MNPDNPFEGKSVAVTGKLGNYTRDDIKARLLELGGQACIQGEQKDGLSDLGRAARQQAGQGSGAGDHRPV